VEHKPSFSQDWSPTPSGSSTPTAPKKAKAGKHTLRIIGIAAGAVVLVGGAVGGGLYWKSHKQTKPAAAATTQTAEQQNTSTDTTPKTYKSDTLNIGFTYPANWRVRENADKTQIMITSPSVTYKKGGVSTKGVFTIKMRTGIIPQAMQTTLQNIIAVKKSEVIAYTAPTDQQRQYTNLSYGGKGDNMSLLLVTGGSDFNPGDTFASGLDMQGAFYLFAGGYGSDPNDSLTFDPVPIASFTTPAVYEQAVSIIESVKVY